MQSSRTKVHGNRFNKAIQNETVIILWLVTQKM